jgi:hypothetical protein
MNGCFANPFALGTGLLRNHTLTSSPWGHGSYGIAADRFTVGAHSVGEAAMPGKVRLGDRAPTESRTNRPVGAHSVGEASRLERFALRTGLLRGVAARLAGNGYLASVSSGQVAQTPFVTVVPAALGRGPEGLLHVISGANT